MNNVMVVGRLAKDLKQVERNGKIYDEVLIEVNRNYRNVEGVYETDFITARIYAGMKEKVEAYLRVGDLIGIRGSLQCERETDIKTLEQTYPMYVRCEKLTFLQANNHQESVTDYE